LTVETRIALARQAVERVAGRGRSSPASELVHLHDTRPGPRRSQCGSNLLLLPMPHFFHYSQGDLVAYTKAVCSAVPVAFLLYNLPSFTGGHHGCDGLQLDADDSESRRASKTAAASARISGRLARQQKKRSQRAGGGRLSAS